jgi:Tol biopolymer transport system component
MKRSARIVLLVASALVGGGCGTAATPATSPASSLATATPTTGAPSPSPTVSSAASPSVSATATPAITGLTGHFGFTRAGGKYEDETVFLINADGSGEKQLTDYGHGGGPSATRDGTKIAFGTYGDETQNRATVAITDVSGSKPRLLPLPKGTINLSSGPFSPDGKRIIREGWDDNDPAARGIYVSNVDGSGIHKLTDQHFIPGDWSPDGKMLLFFEGEDVTNAPPPPGSLFITRSDGTGVRQLTPKETQVQCCWNFRFSPDGKKVLFATQDGGLWTISPDGSGLTQVFRGPTGNWAITPSWSPDGSMIVFCLDDSANPFDHPNNGMYVIRRDGTGLTLLLAGDDFKREPIWIAS